MTLEMQMSKVPLNSVSIQPNRNILQLSIGSSISCPYKTGQIYESNFQKTL